MTELEHKIFIAKNTAALYVRMLVRLAITLYTSRIVLDILGVDDFALYGVQSEASSPCSHSCKPP